MRIEVCNIWYQKCCIEVKKDEDVVCPKCKGHGGFLTGAHFRNGNYSVNQCLVCMGEGKVDWISAITGKSYKLTPMDKYTKMNVKYAKIKCPTDKGFKRIKRMWKQRQDKRV